jgi:hypothetical protein
MNIDCIETGDDYIYIYNLVRCCAVAGRELKITLQVLHFTLRGVVLARGFYYHCHYEYHYSVRERVTDTEI